MCGLSYCVIQLFNSTSVYQLTVHLLVYIECIAKTMFTLDANEINKINRIYRARQPKFLTSQFPDRLGKKDAIEKQNKRKSLEEATLFPPGVTYLRII